MISPQIEQNDFVCGLYQENQDTIDLNEIISLLDSHSRSEAQKTTVINNINKASTDRNKPQSRNYATYNNKLKHGDEVYDINTTKTSGVYTVPMHRIIDEYNWYAEKYIRVHVLLPIFRHTGIHRPDNELMRSFFKKLKPRLLSYCKKQNTSEIGYFWVLEHGKTGWPHYHSGIFIDGDAVRNPTNIKKIIADTWHEICGGDVVYPSKDYRKNGYLYKGMHYYNLDQNSSACSHLKKRLFYHISYACKERSKEGKEAQTNSFGTSQNRRKLINVKS